MKHALLFLILPACFPLYPFREDPNAPGLSGSSGDTTSDTPENTIVLASNALTLHSRDRVVLGLMTSGTQISVGALPSGVSVANSVTGLIFTTEASLVAGTAEVVVTATSDSAAPASATLTITLVATPRVSVTPSQQSILRGATATITITIARDTLFAGVATIEILDLGSALIAPTISPLQPLETERVVTFTSSAMASPAVSSVRVRVTHAGGVLPDVSVAIAVTAAPGTPDFIFGTRHDVAGNVQTFPVQAIARDDASVVLLAETLSDPDELPIAQILVYRGEASPVVLANLTLSGGDLLYPKAMRIDPAGRMLVAGMVNNDGFYLARVLPSGMLDASFAVGGELILPALPGDAYLTCNIVGVFIRGSNIYVVGKATEPLYGCGDAARIKTFVVTVSDEGGAQTPLFTRHTEAGNYNQYLLDSAENDTGLVLVVGHSDHSGNNTVAQTHGLATLDPPALIDGAAQTFASSAADGYDELSSVTATSGGGFYAAGAANRGESRGLVARLLANGAPDPSFGSNGLIVFSPNAQSLATSFFKVMNDASHRALVVGNVTLTGGEKRMVLCRVLSDEPDLAFATGGCALVDPGPGMLANTIAVLDNQQRVWLFSSIGEASIISARYFTD